MGPITQWWTPETVAVVTGGNRGLGFGIARRLALEGITVVLAARDEGRGVKATNDLHAKGLKNVVFRELDIKSAESVTEFVHWIKHTYGGLDILVNNASVIYLAKDTRYEHAVETIDINYRGTVNLTERLLPLLKASSAGARIVNVSSLGGQLNSFTNESLKQQFVDSSRLDQKLLDDSAKRIVDSYQTGEIKDYGVIDDNFTPSYCFSKLLVNAYTRLLAQRVAGRPEGKKIYVNCLHPGLIDTGMYQQWKESVDDATNAEFLASHGVVPISPEEAADTPVWLALLPAGGPSGLFWYNREEFSY